MRIIAILVSMLLSLSGSAQLSKSTNVGYVESFAKLPKIKFEQTDEAQYNQCKTANDLVMLSIKDSKTEFTLYTKSKEIRLKKTNQDQNDFNGYEYLGYYSKLKMYAIIESTMLDNLSFGSFNLLDSLTANYYSIVSIGDGAVETPIPSPNSKYLIYYNNQLTNGGSCFIGLLQVNRSGKASQLFKEKLSFESNKFVVEDIRWLNDQTFIVKTSGTTMKDDTRVKGISYFKASVE
ncbi:hypothetical protein ATK78_2811 [Pedobacter metabolipauper]|uniref:Uncharacterized protein n=2 Tax=Pedobacter metabolipauper TaxID=425513 RepID=A0A4R6SW06_9SPHI|nr:hypothetical protein ATK78_2811 [Pedobacter metabolipauper]